MAIPMTLHISWLIHFLFIWKTFQVNPAVVEQLERSGMRFVGHDDEGKRMEIMELQGTFTSSYLCQIDDVYTEKKFL